MVSRQARLIIGLMIGSYGAGSGIFGPIAASMLDEYGWRSVFRLYALMFFCMTMMAAYLLRNPPAGYQPPNWQVERVRSKDHVDVPASQMVRTSTFWSLWVAYCLGTTAGTMVISQLVPFAKAAGHGATVAGRRAWRHGGGARDNGGRDRECFGAHLLRVDVRSRGPTQYPAAAAAGVRHCDAGALPAARAGAAFYILVGVVYYCYGTQLSVYASTSADFYGTRNIGFNYGLLFVAWGCAGVLGPFIGGRVYVATGEYQLAFFLGAGAALAALVALTFARNPHRSEAPAFLPRHLRIGANPQSHTKAEQTFL